MAMISHSFICICFDTQDNDADGNISLSTTPPSRRLPRRRQRLTSTLLRSLRSQKMLKSLAFVSILTSAALAQSSVCAGTPLQEQLC